MAFSFRLCRSVVSVAVPMLCVTLRPLSAQVVGFEESFSGNGDYQSVGGAFDGLDNPGWAMAAEGTLTDEGYAFDLVDEGVPLEERIMRRLHGQGSYTQQILISDLKLGDRNETNAFGTASEVAIHHFFTVDDLSSRAIISIGEPVEEGVWQLVLATSGPVFRREVALILKGGECASLGLSYDQEDSRITGFYDADLLDEVPPTVLTLPIELDLSDERELRLYIVNTGLEASGVLRSWTLQPVSDIEGDFNGNGILDARDIDQLSAQVRSITNDSLYDLNADTLVNDLDRQFWVHDLKQTNFGDADLNGSFDSTDLVQVLASGEYEDGIELNSMWLTGDWNGDGDFTSGDLVVALADGGYEAVAAAVPEPAGLVLAMTAAALVAIRRRGCAKTRRA